MSETRCESCGTKSGEESLAAALWCCPACGFHLPMPSLPRLRLIADDGSLGGPIDEVTGGDPLSFRDARPYPERLAEARAETGEGESFVARTCTIGGIPSLVGALDFAFMGGTMSAAVGERVARAFERAGDERRTLVLCTASGGARMQEGTLSLFQMTKTSAARARFRATGLPYLSVLCHPTLGGVAASWGTLADVLLVEPQARVGFAGPRVIEQLMGHPLPPGFQRAEYLVDHGFGDAIVPRPELRATLVRLVRLLSRPAQTT